MQNPVITPLTKLLPLAGTVVAMAVLALACNFAPDLVLLMLR
jgi:hypothetical protein